MADLASARLRQAAWHLAVAGNGDDAPFRNQSEMSGLADKVTFHGWMAPPKMHDLFAASDVLVLPSRNEGLPMVIVEAMASGLAVISTPVGSISDAVVDGVNVGFHPRTLMRWQPHSRKLSSVPRFVAAWVGKGATCISRSS